MKDDHKEKSDDSNQSSKEGEKENVVSPKKVEPFLMKKGDYTIHLLIEEVKNFEVKEAFLTEASGYSFYNTSKYDFEKLLSDPDNIESNFKNYLSGFSDNIQDILSNFVS